MSLSDLDKKEVFVLGPLELSPGNFAVGPFTYSAIRGSWPRFNQIRQQLAQQDWKEASDAMGIFEARALAAESFIDGKDAEIKSLKAKNKDAERKAAAREKELSDKLKIANDTIKAQQDKLKAIMSDDKKSAKKRKGMPNDQVDSGLDSSAVGSLPSATGGSGATAEGTGEGSKSEGDHGC